MPVYPTTRCPQVASYDFLMSKRVWICVYIIVHSGNFIMYGTMESDNSVEVISVTHVDEVDIKRMFIVIIPVTMHDGFLYAR